MGNKISTKYIANKHNCSNRYLQIKLWQQHLQNMVSTQHFCSTLLVCNWALVCSRPLARYKLVRVCSKPEIIKGSIQLNRT